MMRGRNALYALTILTGASAGVADSAPVEAQAIAAAPAGDARCAALSGQKLGTAEVVSASFQPANTFVPGAFFPDYFGIAIGRPISGLPALWRIVARSRTPAEGLFPIEHISSRLAAFKARKGIA